MNFIKRLLLATALVSAVLAQAPTSPLDDKRLTIHTLVREDIFAGFMNDDLERLARGEKSAQALLEKRPEAKAPLLAWQAGATLNRAVLAWENKKTEEFQQGYARAQDLFAQSKKANANDPGAAAVIGGSFVIFADRLPKAEQAAAWQQAYDAYQMLWKFQGAGVENLPVHIRGELLGGLAVSAQRTGRKEEATQYLDRMLQVMADTPYGNAAKKWKENPKVAMSVSLTCLNCHESGRLAARVASLKRN